MAHKRLAKAEGAATAAAPVSRWVSLSMAAFALIAAVLFGFATVADREGTLAQGRVTALNTAALLAEHADRSIRIAQLTAARVEELVRREGPDSLGPELHGQLRAIADTAPEVGTVAIFDGAGVLVASSLKPSPAPADVSDRPFFRAIHGGATEHLSGLIRTRNMGGWFFTWNRAIRIDGRLVAVAHIAMPAAEFGRVSERLALGPGAELRLVRPDGTIVMWWPLPPQEPVEALPRRQTVEGFDTIVSPSGMAQLIAWRAAPSAPVVAEARPPASARAGESSMPLRSARRRNGARTSSADSIASATTGAEGAARQAISCAMPDGETMVSKPSTVWRRSAAVRCATACCSPWRWRWPAALPRPPCGPGSAKRRPAGQARSAEARLPRLWPSGCNCWPRCRKARRGCGWRRKPGGSASGTWICNAARRC